ncbi:hypothetical protein COLU111180_02915 [Cohnella lubricantis]|nr:hypothetical protein [Cohnella lubricantis]
MAIHMKATEAGWRLDLRLVFIFRLRGHADFSLDEAPGCRFRTFLLFMRIGV